MVTHACNSGETRRSEMQSHPRPHSLWSTPSRTWNESVRLHSLCVETRMAWGNYLNCVESLPGGQAPHLWLHRAFNSLGPTTSVSGTCASAPLGYCLSCQDQYSAFLCVCRFQPWGTCCNMLQLIWTFLKPACVGNKHQKQTTSSHPS